MERDSARLLTAASALVDQGLEIIILLDAFGIVQAASNGVVRRLGQRPDELVGRAIIDVVHQEDRGRLAAELLALANSAPGAAVRLEYRVGQHGGSVRWLRTLYVNYLANPEVGAIVATCQDVTEYREATDAFLDSHRRFETVFATTLDALLLCDDDRRYVEVNPAACLLLGRSREQLLRLRIDDVLPEDEREGLAAAWQAFLTNGRAAGEQVLIHADGTRCQVEFRSVANVLPGVHLAAIRDCSARRAAEDQADLLQRQLRALTGRLHSLQEEERHRIAREVHDELGQLLTALKLDLAWSKRRLASQGRAEMSGIREKCDIMSALVDDAIGSVRRIVSGLHPTELDQLGLIAAIEAHVREFSVRTGIVASVVATLDDSNIEFETRVQLLRITQEATTNVSRHAHATDVTITVDRDHLGLRLEIADNGCGMAVVPRGSLGLLGMKERARLCGGELHVESSPDRGTSVRVLILGGGSMPRTRIGG